MMKMFLSVILNILLRPQKDSDLALESLALRQQLAIWKRHKKRHQIRAKDRLFWITLCRFRGTPRIHGELLKLGIKISERTVSNLTHHRVPKPPPSQTWRTFLKNHMSSVVSIDFFTVPTATFRIFLRTSCRILQRCCGGQWIKNPPVFNKLSHKISKLK